MNIRKYLRALIKCYIIQTVLTKFVYCNDTISDNTKQTETQKTCLKELNTMTLFNDTVNFCGELYVANCETYDEDDGKCILCQAHYNKTVQDNLVSCDAKHKDDNQFLVISIFMFIIVMYAYCKFFVSANNKIENGTVFGSNETAIEPIIPIKNWHNQTPEKIVGMYHEINDKKFDKDCQFNFQIN